MNAAVIDTNVLVPGVISPHGAAGRIVDALREGSLRAVIDDRIWDEYEEVLHRPAFGFAHADVDDVLARLRRLAIQAPVETLQRAASLLPAPSDAPFLECAAALGVPLVTGNVKHFPARVAGHVEVLLPTIFLARLKTL